MCIETNITYYIENYKTWQAKWKHCHMGFIHYVIETDNENRFNPILTSVLKDYLGSFGMRRAGFLKGDSCDEKLSFILEQLKKNYDRSLLELDYANYDLVREKARSILSISNELECELLRRFSNFNGLNIPTISTVLVTKILMATYCCVPGFDSKLQSALSKSNMSDKFNEMSLIKLSDYYNKHISQFNSIEYNLPSARKLDMHLWMEG